MLLKPLADRLVVRPAEHTGRSQGGVYLPTEETPYEGVVEAVGPGRMLDNGSVVPLTVNVGDTVVFTKHSGTEIKLGGEKFLVLHESDVIGVKA